MSTEECQLSTQILATILDSAGGRKAELARPGHRQVCALTTRICITRLTRPVRCWVSIVGRTFTAVFGVRSDRPRTSYFRSLQALKYAVDCLVTMLKRQGLSSVDEVDPEEVTQ
eukprot:2920286-Pyramimonas_sp.AAC.1